MVLIGPKGGEMSIDDIIDEYCVEGTISQGGNIPIKHIVYRPLRNVAFMIDKVVSYMYSHYTTHSQMLYSVECMAPTIFNRSERLLVSLKDHLKKCQMRELN